MREDEIQRRMNELFGSRVPRVEPVATHFLPGDGIEAHMMGNYVAVVWNLESTQSRVQKGGQIITIETHQRKGDPYINFIWIREDENTGEAWRSEDSPVDGGISASEAEHIIVELQRAIQYLSQLDREARQE